MSADDPDGEFRSCFAVKCEQSSSHAWMAQAEPTKQHNLELVLEFAKTTGPVGRLKP